MLKVVSSEKNLGVKLRNSMKKHTYKAYGLKYLPNGGLNVLERHHPFMFTVALECNKFSSELILKFNSKVQSLIRRSVV